MTAITVSSSGLWSVVVGASDGDRVTIPAGYAVIFDVDQSGWSTGLTGLVVNGDLKFKTDSNTCLMMATNTNITGTGNFGNPSTDPLNRPDVGSAYRCKIILKGTSMIDVTYQNHYGWIPDLNFTTLTNAAALNDTTITLDEDLGLQAGDRIGITSGTEIGVLAEASGGIYTVQSYNSGTRVVTLTSGLQTARLKGDYVCWVSRTTRIERSPAATTTFTTKTSITYQGTLFYGFKGCQANSGTMIGCTAERGWFGLGGAVGWYMQDCTGVYAQSSHLLSYGGDSSTYLNCIGFNSPNPGFYLCKTSFIQNCVVRNASAFIHNSGGCYIGNSDANNNSVADMNNLGECMFYNFISGSTLAAYGYNTSRKWLNNESHDHNGIDGNYRAWMKGGYILTDTSFVHGSAESSLKFVIEDNYPVFREYFILVPKNKTVKFPLAGYKDFSGGTVKIQLIDPAEDPMIDSTKSALAETNMADVSSEWKSFKLQYKSDYTKYCILRIFVQNTSGNAWFDVTKLEKMLATKKTIVM